MDVTGELFGLTEDGQPVQRFTLRNGTGMVVRLLEWGAYWAGVTAPDREGRYEEVTLGYDTLEGYLGDKCCFGGVCGRFANRIALGRFALDGVSHQLETNNGLNHLHGGCRGFHKRLWKGEALQDSGRVGVRFTYRSVDGEEHYPGNLEAQIEYWLDKWNRLTLLYRSQADRPTPVNLTNHVYFNLKGSGDILDHELEIAANQFTPITAQFIPTGELRPVEGTPLDFRTPHRIGDRIEMPDEQLQFGLGYDHNWVLDHGGGSLSFAARVREASTGRVVEVQTTQPGLQFYCGNFLDGTAVGRSGTVYHRRYGLCLETQHFPDSPNHPGFPNCILRPGELFEETAVFAFSAE